MKSFPRIVFPAALALVLAAASPVSAATETYKIDPVHSAIGFSVRHFVSKVPGRFKDFSGTITVDRNDLTKSTAEATIQIASIDTENQKRDDHLRSADFFDAAKFPTMKFKSKTWKKTGADSYDVTGDLTIKDVTKEVVLKVTALGFGPGMQGAQLSGWEATTKIDKKDFNVNDPAMLDAALGDDVAITLNIEATTKG